MAYPSPYVAIVDVGHGNCSILRDNDKTVIIDCGSKSSGLLEFLKKEGINEIDTVFISHADQDHIGGLIGLISTGNFAIQEIYFNSDSTKGSGVWDDLAYILDELHESGKTKLIAGIKHGLTVSCGDILIEVTGPSTYLVAKGVGGKDRQDRKINSNSLSASFNIYWKKSNIAFLAGDIDQIGLEELLERGINIKSPVLVFPHHGGKSGGGNPEAFVKTLCDHVAPNTVLFSIGRTKFDNPRPEIVKAVLERISNVRVSCTQLSKHCVKRINLRNSDHLVDVFSRGREDYFCCSGTFLIRLGEASSHFPDLDSHQRFIKKATTNPLCLNKA